MIPLSRLSPPARPAESKSQSGFTLIELLVVIAVIFILVGITFGISRGVQNAQARAKAKAELAVIAQALEQFKSRHGDYPWAAANPGAAESNGERLFQALMGFYQFDASSDPPEFKEKETDEIPVSGPNGFVDPTKLSMNKPDDSLPEDPTKIPSDFHFVDPWGNPYVYRYKSSSSDGWDKFGYVLFSRGPDGKTGTPIPDTGIQPEREGDAVDNIYAGES